MENNCEESTTKCKNEVCDTTKRQFKAENYQPQVPVVEQPPAEIANLPEFQNLAQVPSIVIKPPFDNSGLIDLVTNLNNFSFYWSNSKHVSKKCQNNVCTITTKTCTNGKCEESVVTEGGKN